MCRKKKEKKDNDKKPADIQVTFYYEEDIRNADAIMCNEENCQNYIVPVKDTTGFMTFVNNDVTSHIKSKGKGFAITAAYDFTYKFMMSRLASFIMVVSLTFGTAATVNKVVTANENSKPENKVAVYGGSEVKEESFSEVIPEVEDIVEEIIEEITKTPEEPVEESFEEWFTSIHNNSDINSAFMAYWDYAQNSKNGENASFDFPYGVSSGALASYLREHEPANGIVWSAIGNYVYCARPLDESVLSKEDVYFEEINDSTHVHFARLTIEQIDGGWYVTADEPCFITFDEITEMQNGN